MVHRVTWGKQMVPTGRLSTLIFLVLICALAYYFLERSRRGKVPQIRKLAALDAIDEAVARSIEMGKAIHFTQGNRSDLTRADVLPQTLAGISVLSYIATLCARHGGDLIVTAAVPQIVPVSEDTVKTAYIAEGKGEEYRPDIVQYLGSGYQIGLIGTLARHKPGANIYIGGLGAEALYLVEVGNIYGCINIGGTARPIQLPFVVAGSDYFLVAEEMFAAGAYLSKDPIAIGSIAGEDISRYIVMGVLIVGAILLYTGIKIVPDFLKM